MKLIQPHVFRYMLGAPEPVQFFAHTPQQALEAAAENPSVRAVIGKNNAPLIGDLQVLVAGRWEWVI